MNKMTVFGRVVADAEVKYSKSGDPYSRVRIASDIGWGDNKKTLWMDAMLFKKRAESLAPHMLKGTKVALIGSLQEPETWQRNDGTTAVSLTLWVDDVMFTSPHMDASGTQPRPAAREASRSPAPPPVDYDQDLPF